MKPSRAAEPVRGAAGPVRGAAGLVRGAAGPVRGAAGLVRGAAGPVRSEQPLLAADFALPTGDFGADKPGAGEPAASAEMLELADVLIIGMDGRQANRLSAKVDAARQVLPKHTLGLRLLLDEPGLAPTPPPTPPLTLPLTLPPTLPPVPPSGTQAAAQMISEAVNLGVSYIWSNTATLSAWLSHIRSQPLAPKPLAPINWVLSDPPDRSSDLTKTNFAKIAKELKRLYIEYPVENLKDNTSPAAAKAVDLRRGWVASAADPAAADPAAADPAASANPAPADPAAADPAAATPQKIATAVWAMFWGAELLLCADHDLPAIHQARQVCYRELAA